MSWTLLTIIATANLLALLLVRQRRADLARTTSGVAERANAKERGSHKARLQYPHVNLAKCIGCGSCVRACPEEQVLDMVHGQAVVIHGARCVGHGVCATECPTAAIVVTLGEIDRRRDIPVLTDELEVPSRPGLFLAGEVTGYSLIRTAITHGTAVADAVKRRLVTPPPKDADKKLIDLCIVGMGPAGLACSLRAKELGIEHVCLERDEIGGTVAKYPRRKLVMTQPVTLPGHGRLQQTSYMKEELMELWREVESRHELPVQAGQEFQVVEQGPGGVHRVKTSTGEFLARNVVLALGRRGLPRKLGVPGEELPKVGYGLVDAQSYKGRRVLVVGGGDSAIEAAIALSKQPKNRVTLSYRKADFNRLKAKNEAALNRAWSNGKIDVQTESQVLEIGATSVALVTPDGTIQIVNDDVFVMIGGEPPFQQLEASGVSFDPAEREQLHPPTENRTGLTRALWITTALSTIALVWVLLFEDYYQTALHLRSTLADHENLRPSGTAGLAFGIAGTLLIIINLVYLVRRSKYGKFLGGTLKGWMTSHIVTGILSFLLILLHSAMSPNNSNGGHALIALGVLVFTGAVGRYLYAWVPRSTNGRELVLDEIRPRMAALSAEWDSTARGTGERFRAEIDQLIAIDTWTTSMPKRLVRVFGCRHRLKRTLSALTDNAREEGIPEDQISDLSELAQRAYWTAFSVAHLEDLRGLLASWRYLHRWVALLMFLLAVMHIVTAIRYGGVLE